MALFYTIEYEHMNTEKISLRPFLESIHKLCSGMSQERLSNFVTEYAKYLPAKERMAFLENMMSFSEARVHPGADETLQDRISDLKDALMERWEAIEDGSYWDEQDWNSYDDEPDYFTEEQEEEIESYFDEADTLFLMGRFKEALIVYEDLYSVFELEKSSFHSLEYYIEINHRETRARYCRCLYETSVPEERAANLMAGMNINAPLDSSCFNIHETYHPMFCDVQNAISGQLPEERAFLDDWIGLLSEINGDRAQVLLLEAVFLRDGVSAVGDLARKWGGKQPRGYLFWLYLLKSEGDSSEIIKIGKEGLKRLPATPLREQLAGEIVQAGEILEDFPVVLEGRREIFHSVSSKSNLIPLLKEAIKQDVFEREIKKVTTFLSDNGGINDKLLAKVLLMKGDMANAFDLAGDLEPLGWSYGHNNAGAVVFAGILSALVIDKIDNARIIQSLFKGYVANSGSFIYQEIMKGLKGSVMTAENKAEYLKWIETLGIRRVHSIVSNKHRRSYGKAAEILGGLAEYYYLMDDQRAAYELISQHRDEIFNRYPAFKRELRSVLSTSRIL